MRRESVGLRAVIQHFQQCMRHMNSCTIALRGSVVVAVITDRCQTLTPCSDELSSAPDRVTLICLGIQRIARDRSVKSNKSFSSVTLSLLL
ncbi:unnamed protein product [Brugia pahangi]|uniref:Dynein light chain n=1 Tax=Brugia pahangi TaxID=6280 RepID=A0A0N4TPA9_BRUPA|nr:unnamed protein product [Brugia pahangi]